MFCFPVLGDIYNAFQTCRSFSRKNKLHKYPQMMGDGHQNRRVFHTPSRGFPFSDRFNSFLKVGSEIGMSYSNPSIAIVDYNYYTPGICMFHVNFQGCGYLVIISSFRSRLGVAVSPMPRTSYHNNHNLVMFHEGLPHSSSLSNWARTW